MHISRLGFAFVVAAGTFSCAGENTTEVISPGTPSGPLTGALFTSTLDGSSVNMNLYDAKPDVYINGGPDNGNPGTPASLPAGDYYFQVTDPSGMVLLSTDALECRRVRVSADGVIVQAYPGPAGCLHLTGVDLDDAALGAITVQLLPYSDTPNNGGEYKVWISPVDEVGLDGAFSGRSKTDTFKIRPVTPPVCGNGTLEPGELCDDGNTVGGDGCSANCTPDTTPPAPRCGDGTLNAGELCDDGNAVGGDGCSANCTPDTTPPAPRCGDGTLDAGELCDDGNAVGGDGCSANCTPDTTPPAPRCGDGTLDAGEHCDDGNTTSGDGCSDVCAHDQTPECDETTHQMSEY